MDTNLEFINLAILIVLELVHIFLKFLAECFRVCLLLPRGSQGGLEFGNLLL